MSANLLSISRQISELIHDEATDFDAPVKIVIPFVEGNDRNTGDREFTVTDVELVVNEDDDSQVVWLSVVEE